jgi:hypothetical protein
MNSTIDMNGTIDMHNTIYMNSTIAWTVQYHEQYNNMNSKLTW